MGPKLVCFKAHLGNTFGVKEERRVLGGRMNLVVVLEFRKWQEPNPVILSLVGEELEILLQFLVDLFHLSISLRVVGCGGCQLNSKQLVEFLGEFCYELGTSIQDNFPRVTMMFSIPGHLREPQGFFFCLTVCLTAKSYNMSHGRWDYYATMERRNP